MQSKWQTKIINFMRGRYGIFDTLNKFLLVISFALLIVMGFKPIPVVNLIPFALLIYIYYRVFSKKIYVRANENRKFMTATASIRKRYHFYKAAVKNRKTYRYFHCPDCHQELRAPKGKGKIKITCSKCHHQFVKKV